MNYLVPASPEVIGHHVRQHTRWCPSGGITSDWCPCQSAVAIICTSCGQAVFIAALYDCIHVLAAVAHG